MLAPDNRPIALFIYPKHDKKNAFSYNQIHEFMKNGYRVLYFEAGCPEEMQAAKTALEATNLYNRIEVFRLGGHSAISNMSFGAPDPARQTLDNTQHALIATRPDEGIGAELNGFEPFLTQNCIVIADGCGAGGGDAVLSNITGAIAKKYPNSWIFAPTRSTQLIEINALFDANHHVYWVSHPALQVIPPTKIADLSQLTIFGEKPIPPESAA
jgi:hypothetical protein